MDNRDAWTDPDIVATYRDVEGIGAAERAVFAAVGARKRGGKVLDLGVGSGRTTPALLEISRDYLGVDYSPGMVETCRAKFPGVAFECRDARELSALPAGGFDLIVCAFNGLDYASHADRARILSGVCRLLKPGGDFAFSSHNRSMRDYDRFPLPWPPLRRKPAVVLAGLARFAKGLLRHWANRRLEVRTPDYAVINEPQYGYALMTYHVTVEEQLRQLREAGFKGGIEVFDRDGAKVRSDSTSRFLHFLATK